MVHSSIAWIDLTDGDRRRMMEVVALFRQRDTRDELGLGSIRDAFANLFFPGTSTLQTRARYFLFVPWLYCEYEKRRIPSSKVARRLRRDEIEIIDVLTQAGEEAVIGQRSRANLQRFPSSIYWNGLRNWGILRYAGSQAQYHRSLDHFHGRQPQRTAYGEPVAGWRDANWDPALPPAPDDFPSQADLRVRPDEARYLREKLLLSCHDSVLATLVDHCEPADDVPFIWMHPELYTFPEQQRIWIGHARCFAEAMYGAALLYNLMLAELRDDEELVAVYRQDLADWHSDLAECWTALQSWDRRAFWRVARGTGRIPLPTQRFVDNWLELILSRNSAPELPASRPARNLVRQREVWLKRGRSRLQSRRHLEMWSGAAGAFEIDYRWFIARRITNDIIRGLRETSDAGA